MICFCQAKNYCEKWQFFQGTIQTKCIYGSLSLPTEHFALALCAFLSNTDEKVCKKSGLGAIQLVMFKTFYSDIAV